MLSLQSMRQPATSKALLRSMQVSCRLQSTQRASTAGPASDGATAMLDELVRHQKARAELAVPWFVENMPDSYFRLVRPATRAQHLRAITAFGEENLSVPEVKLTDGSNFTFLSPGGAVGGSTSAVARQLASLPADAGLRRVLLFSSTDGRLSLNMFETSQRGAAGEVLYGHDASAAPAEIEMRSQLEAYAKQLANGSFIGMPNHPPPSSRLSTRELERFLSNCASRFVVDHVPRLLYKQLLLYLQVAHSERTAVELEHNYEGSESRTLITAAMTGIEPRQALKRTLTLLSMSGLELERAQLDKVGVTPRTDATTTATPTAPPTATAAAAAAATAPTHPGVTLLRAVVHPSKGRAPLSDAEWRALGDDMHRIKWVDEGVLALAASNPKFGLLRAEVCTALAELSLSLLDHPLLGYEHLHQKLLQPHVQTHALALSELFLRRHDPHTPLADAQFGEACMAWEAKIEAAFGNEETRALMRTMGSALKHTLRTNVHVPERFALSLRLQPQFFEPVLPPSPDLNNMPFGVFFSAGRHFCAYHVRFRDISRGGLRVVLPSSLETHAAESRRQFAECFNLAWAQQLKNKDIPEGGSKAVCLVRPQPDERRDVLLHDCVKKFTDSLLDLLTPDETTRSHVAHASAGQELLYLGPDENITPTDIDWVVARAKARGYPMAAAFMSSKPREGINHKEFGVTSEGVAIFLDSGLRAIGISPRNQPWSLKLTGGPDGDVAGNMIKIMHREYGDNVRVVGISDGSATVEDPLGISMPELLRLVEQSAPLSALSPAVLSPHGVLTLADTPEGFARRNTMHSRVVADAFVPAGGRPATINSSNWREMLLPDGSPNTKLIVEGANLFLTAEARQALFDATKLPVVKDSSANKCGVCCSSLEIVASMVLSADEFVKIKPRYVEEVLEKLRSLARLEAELLFSEARKQPDESLPELSVRISKAILRVRDALGVLMDTFDETQKQRLWPLTRELLPPVLFENYAQRLPERLPWNYTKSMIAAGLASRMVYREGLSYTEGLAEGRLAEFALTYLKQEQHVRALAAQVVASGVPHARDVEALLLRGGIRAAAEHPHGVDHAQ